MARSSTGRVLLVVCLLFLATGTVAATPIAPASDPAAIHGSSVVETLGTPIEDATNTTDDTTNTTTDTTDSTTTIDEMTDDVTDSTSTTTTTTETTTTTTTKTTTTTTPTTQSVEDTADSTTGTADSTTDSTVETTEETVDTTVEQTSDVESSVTNVTSVSLESSTSVDTVAGGTSLDTTVDGDGALDATTDSLDQSTSSVDESVSSVVDATDDTVHVASNAGDTGPIHAASSGSESGASTTDGPGDSVPGDSTNVDTETAVHVEETDGSDSTVGLLASAYRRLGGMVPESVPGGPLGGAAGLGGLALAAVVSRQWLAQTAGTGTPSFLTSGFSGRLDDWLEKLKRLAVPLRYSRYDDSDPLEHEARRALYEVIESTPGVYLTDLAEQADVPVSTARHHVRVLNDERLVRTEKRHGKRRYYPVTATDTELTDALSEPAKAAVLHALAEHGESHVGVLADELDRDPSTVTHHLQALAEDDLVERERQGRAVVNRLADDVESLLTGGEVSLEPADRVNAPADD